MIKLAALVVGGVYVFRRFTEGTAEQEKRSTKIAPLGQFVIAWGTVFLVLSIAAPATPTLAGNMALLLMVASLLSNGIQVSADLKAGMNRSLKERQAAIKQSRGFNPPGLRGPVGRETSTTNPEPLEVRSV
jgi:hypothetical protein